MTLNRSGLVVTGFLTCASCGAAPIAKQSFYQESRTTITRDKASQTVTRRIWVKYPGKVRMEETLGDKSRLTVSNGSDLWIVLPAMKKGQHRKLTPQEAKSFAGRLNVDLDMVPKFLAAGAKKVRQEKVNGVLCDVYERARKEQLTLTLWVAASGPRLAQRQQESGIVRAAERLGEPMKTYIVKSVTDYLKWVVDKPIDDTRFSAPGGVMYQEAASGPRPAGPGQPPGKR